MSNLFSEQSVSTLANVYGVDFGSQKAGTTVICHVFENELQFIRSERERSADEFLLRFFREVPSALIGIDAPLSLPGVYRGLHGFNDYQYRVADRELRAMSPMFLGGLTARAMKIASELREMGHSAIEVYPTALSRLLGVIGSKGELSSDEREQLAQQIQLLPLPQSFRDSHERDAFFALVSAIRFRNGRCNCFGAPDEGLIHV